MSEGKNCCCDWCVESMFPPRYLTKEKDGCANNIEKRIKKAMGVLFGN